MVQNSTYNSDLYYKSPIAEGMVKLPGQLCPEIRKNVICITEFKEFMLRYTKSDNQNNSGSKSVAENTIADSSWAKIISEGLGHKWSVQTVITPAYRRFTFDDVKHYTNGVCVYLGQRHSDSFGFENVSYNLHRLRAEGQNADYTGMTDAEIFKSIFDRYEEVFSGFKFARAVSYPTTNTATGAIWTQFEREINNVFGRGNTERRRAATREAFFGDKSDTEIRKAIAANYPPAGQITLRQFLHMRWEMVMVGVDAGIGHAMSINGMDTPEREMLLDRPLDIRWLVNGLNHLNGLCPSNVNVQQSRGASQALQDIFGVHIDQRGHVSATNHNQIDFTALLNQLREMFMNWTTADFERWLEQLG